MSRLRGQLPLWSAVAVRKFGPFVGGYGDTLGEARNLNFYINILNINN